MKFCLWLYCRACAISGSSLTASLLSFPTSCPTKSAALDGASRVLRFLQALRQHAPEEFRTTEKLKDLLFAIAKPIRHEAVFQFALRKSIRKTVTPGKNSATPADSSQGALCKGRHNIANVDRSFDGVALEIIHSYGPGYKLYEGETTFPERPRPLRKQ